MMLPMARPHTPVLRAVLCRATGAALAVTALAVAGSSAATPPKPATTTGSARSITATSAVVTGTVTPNTAPTTYYVQYGTTSQYGLASMPTTEPKLSGTIAEAVSLGNLAANTTYHYRFVATNAFGTAVGKGRSFATLKIPLTVQIAATPSEVLFMGPTTISGTLAGTGNANREVVLQASNPPYTTFTNVGNPELTNAGGSFTFYVPTMLANTQFRVVAVVGHLVVSPVAQVAVDVVVTAHARKHRTRHGTAIRFRGTVSPAEDGSPMLIQRLTGARWVTVAQTPARRFKPLLQSTFDKTIQVRHGGFFRVFARINDASHVSEASLPELISTRHR